MPEKSTLAFEPAAAGAVVTPIAPVFAGAETGPTPPSLNWFLLIVLATVTLGLFGMIWAFIETGFIKKISPKCNGRGLLLLAVAMDLAYLIMLALYNFAGSTFGLYPHDAFLLLVVVGAIVAVSLPILLIRALFRMRTGLLDYYNSTEPIQLRLSKAMTFFFNIYYFQYHLSRIAKWKKTGQLAPQS
jgi:hypothetical protein